MAGAPPTDEELCFGPDPVAFVEDVLEAAGAVEEHDECPSEEEPVKAAYAILSLLSALGHPLRRSFAWAAAGYPERTSERMAIEHVLVDAGHLALQEKEGAFYLTYIWEGQ